MDPGWPRRWRRCVEWGKTLAMPPAIVLEACCGSVEEAAAAQAGGADRLELCAALPTGGVTPSIGMMHAAKEVFSQPIVAMIRPKEGRPSPSPEEQRAALLDVKPLIQAGADELIFGWLTADGRVDKDGMKRMLDEADGTPCCFHRVFDMCRDLDEALEDIIEVGFIRVLTSGGQPNVDLGLDRLRQLQQRAGDRMVILPGGGVRESNVQDLVGKAGLKELHFSFRQKTGIPGYQGDADTTPMPERIRAIRGLVSGP